jgi:hypothetical protein
MLIRGFFDLGGAVERSARVEKFFSACEFSHNLAAIGIGLAVKGYS